MNSLIVALNGIPVGQLKLEPSGAMAFQYNTDWLNRPGARPISLSLPLSAQRHRGALVYNFFDNLLPDSDVIRGRMQARFKIPTSHPFDLLSRIGRDCVGAIQLYPSDFPVPPVAAGLSTGKPGQGQFFQDSDTFLAYGSHRPPRQELQSLP